MNPLSAEVYKVLYLFTLDPERALQWYLEEQVLTEPTNSADRKAIATKALQVLKKNKFEHSRSQKETTNAAWPLPELFVKRWAKFCKRASYEELEAVIFNGYLGLSIPDIADVVHQPLGSVSFRLGHGYKKLGALKEEILQ